MLARPRRSVLYMPGSNAKALAKAATLPADALILDLEDSVAPDAKIAARGQVTDAVRKGGFGAPRGHHPRQRAAYALGRRRSHCRLPPPGRTPYCCPRSTVRGRSWPPPEPLREAGAPDRTRASGR